MMNEKLHIVMFWEFKQRNGAKVRDEKICSACVERLITDREVAS